MHNMTEYGLFCSFEKLITNFHSFLFVHSLPLILTNVSQERKKGDCYLFVSVCYLLITFQSVWSRVVIRVFFETRKKVHVLF